MLAICSHLEEERIRREEEEQRLFEEEQIRLAEEARKAEEERLRLAIEEEEKRKAEESARREQERIAVRVFLCIENSYVYRKQIMYISPLRLEISQQIYNTVFILLILCFTIIHFLTPKC